jgi:hypothetical protein
MGIMGTGPKLVFPAKDYPRRLEREDPSPKMGKNKCKPCE